MKYEDNLFKNKDDALNILNKSRKEIDNIDNQLIELISRRTSFAKDILFAKKYLNKEIFDESREKAIHDKFNKLAIEYNLDEKIISQIVNMLTILSKNEQVKILRR